VAKGIAERGRLAGFAGVVLMGLKFETAVGEAYDVWHDQAVSAIGSGDISEAPHPHRVGVSVDRTGA
jgi:hypothetical protein